MTEQEVHIINQIQADVEGFSESHSFKESWIDNNLGKANDEHLYTT